MKAELQRYLLRFRELQLEAIGRLMRERKVDTKRWSPEAVLLVVDWVTSLPLGLVIAASSMFIA